MHQRPIFDSGVIASAKMETSLTHFTPVPLYWHEFWGLNLDQWVWGNGQVSILDQFRCYMDAPEAKLWHWGQWVSLSQSGTSLTHSTLVCLVWYEFGGLNLDQWVWRNGQVSILDQFRCYMDAPEAKLWHWGQWVSPSQSGMSFYPGFVWFGMSLGAISWPMGMS